MQINKKENPLEWSRTYNIFDITDVIIFYNKNNNKPLSLNKLLAILYFYQIMAKLFLQFTPFVEDIEIKKNYIYIEDINKKYKKYKKDTTQYSGHLLVTCFNKASLAYTKFIFLIDNICEYEDKFVMKKVRSTSSFKKSKQQGNNIIDFSLKDYCSVMKKDPKTFFNYFFENK